MSMHPSRPLPSTARRRALTCVAGLLIAAAAPGLFAGEPALPAGLAPPSQPTAMPAFELPTVGGPTLRAEQLKGQTLVIRFWASW
jgi:hypothetical protein